ncbi:hypothetical protein TNCV_2874361 [Trichonephila clavipes]|nr:hypothetical protein TNCV_2874361 [Trichonephila clavipes]
MFLGSRYSGSLGADYTALEIIGVCQSSQITTEKASVVWFDFVVPPPLGRDTLSPLFTRPMSEGRKEERLNSALIKSHYDLSLYTIQQQY